jgi:hypothetical protein
MADRLVWAVALSITLAIGPPVLAVGGTVGSAGATTSHSTVSLENSSTSASRTPFMPPLPGLPISTVPGNETRYEPPPSTAGFLETSYHLTGFNPLTGYLTNGNGLDTQIPTLSSDADQPFGIYYVDNSSNLDALSIATGEIHTVAHVTLLYQRYGYNEMLDNEFFLEYGSDTALFFGTLSTSTFTYSIELVDLASGTVRIWNTSAKTDAFNQEPVYVGNDTVVVFSSNDSAIAYNLASRESWSAGSLPFFESNNIYWLPEKQQLINIEAEGSNLDEVEQLNVSFDIHGHVHLTKATEVAVDSGVTFNFVNGLGYNGSSNEIAFTAGYAKGHTVNTYTIPYGSNGLLTTIGESKWPVFVGAVSARPTLFNGQRYIYTSDYVLGSVLNGTQYLFDPWNGSTVATNRTFLGGSDLPCANACFEDTYAPSVDYLIDINATEAFGVPFYHVVYAHQASSGAYPTAPKPGPPTDLTVGRVTSTDATLSWNQSPGGGILNNTVYRFMGADCTGVPLLLNPGSAVSSYSFPVGILEPASTYSSYVTSWNATGESAPSNCVTFTTTVAPAFNVTFTESGLPSGTMWNVTVADSTNSSTSSTVGFREPSGTYAYRIGLVAGYFTTDSGLLSVGSSSLSVSVKFSPTTYTVKFTEKGLPSKTQWCVTLESVRHCSKAVTISFAKVPNGTYAYTIGHLKGYRTSTGKYAGSVTVAGSGPATVANSITVTWTKEKSSSTALDRFASGVPGPSRQSVGLSRADAATPISPPRAAAAKGSAVGAD